MYYMERVRTSSGDSNIMHYDRFGGVYRAVDEFKQAEGSESFDYINNLVKMNNQMEEMKVQFGMVTEVPYTYHVIQKDDNSFRLDEQGNKMETPTEGTTEEPTQ